MHCLSRLRPQLALQRISYSCAGGVNAEPQPCTAKRTSFQRDALLGAGKEALGQALTTLNSITLHAASGVMKREGTAGLRITCILTGA